jgi:hypothetical protein
MRYRNPSMRKEGAKRLCCVLCACCLFVLFLCPAGHAADVFIFTGGEFDGREQGFAYFGVDVTQRINETVAVAGRVMPSYLTYKYYSGNTLIKANSPGLSAVAGVKLYWSQTMLGIYGGADFRNTDLSPDDLSSSMRGSTASGLIQGELDSWLTARTNLYVFASYTGINNFSYELGRLKQQITNLDYKEPYTMLLGVEQFIGRNSDFNGQGYGGMVEFYYIPEKISLALRGGYKRDSTFGDGYYVGLQLYKAF